MGIDVGSFFDTAFGSGQPETVEQKVAREKQERSALFEEAIKYNAIVLDVLNSLAPKIFGGLFDGPVPIENNTYFQDQGVPTWGVSGRYKALRNQMIVLVEFSNKSEQEKQFIVEVKRRDPGPGIGVPGEVFPLAKIVCQASQLSLANALVEAMRQAHNASRGPSDPPFGGQKEAGAPSVPSSPQPSEAATPRPAEPPQQEGTYDL